MTSPRLVFDDFFRNPFGGEIKSISGMGGGDGVLENIQQQVADNGEALQALQGGIGGLPSGNLPPGGIGKAPPGKLPSPGLIDPQPIVPPSSEPGMPEPQNPMPDFRKMVTDSYRKEGIDDGFFDSEFYLNTFDGGGMSGIFGGPEGQVVVMSKYFGAGGSNSGARDAAYENYLRATGQEDKIISDYNYTDIGNVLNLNDITPALGNLTPVDPFRTPNLNTMEIGNVGNTRLAGPLDQYGVAQDPSIGKDLFNIKAPVSMDQLFGRAFAGKPI